ncbi:MAG: hypothetical protein A3H51_02165 [Candidatus Spechtbacteria bacterium RIFCSPLOWO2_02_FULL_38_8]|uniref:Phage holin family protein n=1 Tax=Candidatus Spechtbacteria bacterium RIFCSPLOWO2_02_FULL_38_8 TaxID=1802164 RepID=A0A1G2HFV5_9BACT|nr:MAG: hypothetical protein A3H51_02165 [Candidatus Spechtbacteria bacterium RIFCSPLOWO2_02_FULL_38_8]
MIKILFRILANAGAVYLAARFVDGVTLKVDFSSFTSYAPLLLIIGFVLWLGNTVIRPLVKVLTFPLVIITFGLFNAIINILIVWGADYILPQLEITGIVPLLWTTLILFLVNNILFFLK